jgi:hypothetical protein
MGLALHFNLQSKTKDELMGLYSELFNQLADPHIRKQQREHLYSMMHQLLCELSAF